MTDTPLDLSDLAAVTPRQFAQLVGSAPKDQLVEVMGGEHRAQVLAEIFRRMCTEQFHAKRAANTAAVIHWHVGGRPDGGYDAYETAIADGACVLRQPPEQEPRTTLTMGALEFLTLVSGNGNPVMMFMTGKIKVAGDLGLAANLANIFDIPKA